MSIAAGTISLVSKTPTQINAIATAASGGSGPYTQQWYMSKVTGFSPGASNDLVGKTTLAVEITADADGAPLIPGTTYYLKVVYTDTGHSNDEATASQLAVTTLPPQLSQNQFGMTTYLGSLDLMINPNVVSAQVSLTEAGTLYPGQAVKQASTGNLNGVPKVVACSADTDEVFGFIAYNIKNASFVAGQMIEVALANSCIYLYSTTAIARMAQVTLDLTTNGGVASAASSDRIVGYAFDGCAAAGTLIRVMLNTPSFATA